uniref:Putative secreted peptide n=1 Tax=Anopheles braziliensis TaxID=58242 RepID=A0A2M3ZEL3_9DIPT
MKHIHFVVVLCSLFFFCVVRVSVCVCKCLCKCLCMCVCECGLLISSLAVFAFFSLLFFSISLYRLVVCFLFACVFTIFKAMYIYMYLYVGFLPPLFVLTASLFTHTHTSFLSLVHCFSITFKPDETRLMISFLLFFLYSMFVVECTGTVFCV